MPGFLDQSDPLAIARATIFLPTRRACRALVDLFREQHPHLVLLPRIRPLGALDESDLMFMEKNALESTDTDLPPALSMLERQTVLARLVLRWVRQMEQNGDPVPTPASAGDAVFLAGELGRLLDMLSYEGVPVESLHALPPRELQQHWESAFAFLQIISEHWPRYLSDKNLMEPAQRHRRLMQDEAKRLLQNPSAPVIAAGSTGSVPVTAEFLSAIAKHPCGAVVLPGLDDHLDEESWNLVAQNPSHPQAAMASFMQRVKITRGDVCIIGKAQNPMQEKILFEAMRPAETTDEWAAQKFDDDEMHAALLHASVVEASNESEEALAITLLLREALERENASAALVTPDRALARRVASELKRFHINVDDSAGTPLSATPAGLFARLVAEVAQKKCEGVSCLSLLKHPLCLLGQKSADAEAANSALERLIYRGRALSKGCDHLLKTFSEDSQTEASRKVSAEQRELARERLAKFCSALSSFEACLALPQEQPLGVFIDAHLKALTAFAHLSGDDGAAQIAAFPGGDSLLAFFEALQNAHIDDFEIAGSDYPQVWQVLAAEQPVRPWQREEPRVKIYGLLEMRLMRHERLVLSGLNEGTWPQTASTDPWLSRGMLDALKLPLPERRIGLAAHDFVQAFGHDDVWLTRALKKNGSPTVPSRFLQRLQAVTGEDVFSELRTRGEKIISLARHVAAPWSIGEVKPVSRPQANPPIEARPRQLSVTRVEALVRDPYSVYAETVLKLRAFEPIGDVFDARRRGTLVHEILSDFAIQVSKGQACDAQVLQHIAQRHFSPFIGNTEVAHLWWPRFLNLIPDIVTFENERRQKAQKVDVEQSAEISLNLPAGAFKLTARADRIEKKDEAFAVIDFKTGAPPAQKNIKASFALQLPLQAAMLEAGAFKNAQGVSDELFYIGLDSLKNIKEQRVKGDDVMAFARETMREAQKLLARFDAGAPYRSCADSSYASEGGDYNHLARVNEWGFADGEEPDA